MEGLDAKCNRGISYYSKRGYDAIYKLSGHCKPQISGAIAYIQKTVLESRQKHKGEFKPLNPKNKELRKINTF
jgi:hypothetical protein